MFFLLVFKREGQLTFRPHSFPNGGGNAPIRCSLTVEETSQEGEEEDEAHEEGITKTRILFNIGEFVSIQRQQLWDDWHVE